MTPEPKEIQHYVRFGGGLVGLFKRGCWEIPEIMGATGLALIGIALGVIGCYNYARNDGDNKEYKSAYTVIRANDPRAKRIRNPVFTEYKC